MCKRGNACAIAISLRWCVHMSHTNANAHRQEMETYLRAFGDREQATHKRHNGKALPTAITNAYQTYWTKKREEADGIRAWLCVHIYNLERIKSDASARTNNGYMRATCVYEFECVSPSLWSNSVPRMNKDICFIGSHLRFQLDWAQLFAVFFVHAEQ